LKPQILIIHGPIGSGKSNRAEQISNRAKANGYKVYGVISRRVLRGKETIGYDGYYPYTGETRPMIRVESLIAPSGWKHLRGPYYYNVEAFNLAENHLIEAAHLMNNKTLAVVDEYGHLEASGFGLYPALLRVVEALPGGGKLLILCRTDKVDRVLQLFKTETKVLIMEASRRDFWDSLGDSFI